MNDLKQYYVKSINCSFCTGEITDLQKNITALLPNTGNDHASLSNWSPISLLNIDSKIVATKVVANRLKNILPQSIIREQICLMKGRNVLKQLSGKNDLKVADIQDVLNATKVR